MTPLAGDGQRAAQKGVARLNIACQCYTVTSMRTVETVSITLPPDMLIKAQQRAEREHRTISELFREALRHYMQEDTQWEALLALTRAGAGTGYHQRGRCRAPLR